MKKTNINSFTTPTPGLIFECCIGFLYRFCKWHIPIAYSSGNALFSEFWKKSFDFISLLLGVNTSRGTAIPRAAQETRQYFPSPVISHDCVVCTYYLRVGTQSQMWFTEVFGMITMWVLLEIPRVSTSESILILKGSENSPQRHAVTLDTSCITVFLSCDLVLRRLTVPQSLYFSIGVDMFTMDVGFRRLWNHHTNQRKIQSSVSSMGFYCWMKQEMAIACSLWWNKTWLEFKPF